MRVTALFPKDQAQVARQLTSYLFSYKTSYSSEELNSKDILKQSYPSKLGYKLDKYLIDSDDVKMGYFCLNF